MGSTFTLSSKVSTKLGSALFGGQVIKMGEPLPRCRPQPPGLSGRSDARSGELGGPGDGRGAA